MWVFLKSTKKKDYVLQFAELTELKINNGYLELAKNKISTYLFKEINQELGATLEEPIISAKYIQVVLPPEYKDESKRNYFGDEHISSIWVTIETSDPSVFLEKDQFNDIRINGVLQVPRKERTEIIQREPSDLIVSPTLNDTTKSIYALEQSGSLIQKIAYHFRKNYEENKEKLEKTFDRQLKFYVDQYAKLSNAKKAIDERGKWGDYEKIMSKFLMETGETTARMAELLNYSSKYGSIGIDRHGEFVDEQTKQFKRKLLEFLMVCPLCAGNIYHKLNEQIEKYRKGIELELLVAI